MGRVLFQSIPNMLFVPITILMIQGFMFTVWRVWRRGSRNILFWTISLSLLFFAGWRQYAQILSSRYSEILIVPAVISSCYFIFKTKVLFRKTLCKLLRFRKILPYCFLTVLFVGCLIKNVMHIRNRKKVDYSYFCEVLESDVKKYQNPVFLMEKEFARFNYYYGTKTIKAEAWKWRDEKNIKTLLDKWGQNHDVIYVEGIFNGNETSDTIFPAHTFYPITQWRILAEQPYDDKTGKVQRIYKYDLSTFYNKKIENYNQNTEFSREKITLFSPDCKLKNEAFYTTLKQNYEAKGTDFQMPKFEDSPRNWNWSTYTPQGTHTEVKTIIIENNDNTTKRSFVVSTDTPFALYEYNIFNTSDNYRMYFVLSGERGSVIRPFTYFYDKVNEKYKYLRSVSFPEFVINESNTKYIYSVDISSELFKHCPYFHPGFTAVKGKLQIYEIFMVKN